MKIELPKGFAVPEGVKPGETFEAVVTLKQTKQGFEVLAVDGAPYSEESDEPEASDNPQEEAMEPKEKRPHDSAQGISVPWTKEPQ